MANEVHNFNIGGVDHEVQDLVARQAVAAVQTALDALTSGDTTTAIKTFQEVIDFLDGVTDSETLIGKLNVLNTAINGKYTKPNGGIPASDLEGSIPAGKLSQDVQTSLGKADTAYQKPQTGIPATDLAEGVIPDTSNLATKTELAGKVDKVTGKGLSTNDYTDVDKNKLAGIAAGAEVNVNADWNAVSGDAQILNKPTLATVATSGSYNDLTGKPNIPTKSSDLTNDLGYQTQQQVASAISQAAIEAIVGSGDFALTYDDVTDTYNIVQLIPTLTVGTLAVLSENTKSGSFTVSGVNLKGNVSIGFASSVSGWKLSSDNGTTEVDSLTLSPTDGTLSETTITVIYKGSNSSFPDSIGNTINITSTGAEGKTATASYYEHNGIFVNNNSLSFSEVAGYTDIKTLTVGGSQLTDGITATLIQTGNKFSVSPASLSSSGGTLTISYTPSAGDNNETATLTLSSPGAADVTIALTGNALSQTLSVSENSLAFDGPASTETSAKNIVVTGTNLKSDVDITVPSGFTAKVNGTAVNSLAKEDVMASGGVTVSVTALSTAASGSLAFASGSLSQTVALSWSVTETEEIGATVSRKHGYTTVAGDTPTIDIVFKITKMIGVDGSTTNEVKVVRSDGGVGYKQGGGYPLTLQKVDIPSTISINGHTYDVTALGGGCFGFINWTGGSSLGVQYVNFLEPCKVKSFLTEGNSGVFQGTTYFKGTGTSGNTFVFPSSTTFIGQNTLGNQVQKAIIPDSYISSSVPSIRGNATNKFDFGTGVTGLSNDWYNKTSLTELTFRYNGVFTINSTIANGWSSRTSKLKVYVPSNQIANYEADTNWKTLFDADKVEFLAISE